MRGTWRRTVGILVLCAPLLAAGPALAAGGLSVDEIVEMEKLLAELGFDPGPIDGRIDQDARSAIRGYQEFAALQADGQPSEALLAELRLVVQAFAQLKAAQAAETTREAEEAETAAQAAREAEEAEKVAQAAREAEEAEKIAQAVREAEEAETAAQAAREAEEAEKIAQAAREAEEAETAAQAAREAEEAETAAQAAREAEEAEKAEKAAQAAREAEEAEKIAQAAREAEEAETAAQAAREAEEAETAAQAVREAEEAEKAAQAAREAEEAERAAQATAPEAVAKAPPSKPARAFNLEGVISKLVSKPSRPKGTAAATVRKSISQARARTGPNDGYRDFKLGFNAAKNGDLDLAIKHYTLAIEASDLSLEHLAAALYNRANAYHYSRLYDYAIADYNAAILNKPNFPGAYYNRGFTFEAKGERQRAVDDFTEARNLGLQRLGVRSPDLPPPLL